MDGVVILVRVLAAILNEKITHENPVSLLRELRNQRQWEPDTFISLSQMLLELSHTVL